MLKQHTILLSIRWDLELSIWEVTAFSGEKAMAPHPVLLPGKSHGRRSLEGFSPWGRWGSDTTERLHFHFLLSCIREGNGNPLQCSCLENPRDGRAWWAAVCGVAQNRTWLKRQQQQQQPSLEVVVFKSNRNINDWINFLKTNLCLIFY